MTTFQDPPFQSRRSVRQSEREEAAAEAPLSLPEPPPATGRRARTGDVTGLADSTKPPLVEPQPEPLDYATRGGRVPTYDGPSFSTNPNPATSQDGEQAFRMRDFSPESRRSAAQSEATEAPQAWQPPQDRAAQASSPAQAPSPLDYQTLAGPPAGAVPQQPAEAWSDEQRETEQRARAAEQQRQADAAVRQHAVPVSREPLLPVEQTLTRREIRALQARQEAEQLARASGPVPVAEPSASVSGPVPVPNAPAPPADVAPATPFAGAAPLMPTAGPPTTVSSATVPSTAVPPIAVPPLVEPVSAPPTATALANAMAEFESLTRAAQQKSSPEAVTAMPPAAPDAAQSVPSPASRPQEHGAASTGEPVSTGQRPSTGEPVSTGDLPTTQHVPTADGLTALFGRTDPATASPARAAEPAAFDFLLRPEAPAAAPAESPFAQQQPPAAVHPGTPQALPAGNPPADELTPRFVEPELPTTGQSYATSTGHWSNQVGLDDESQPFENTLSRELGRANTTTTNALVLPEMSQHTDFAASLNATGEVLVTGSINLPDGFASRGGDSRRYDDPEVDHLFDAFDNEIISTDSAPVRAIRSVSTQTGTRGVIHANKPHGNRMLTVLLVAGCVMAVAVGALLVAGFVFRIF